MTKKVSKESLADRIAGVLSAAPAQFDPDDEHLDDSKAKLTDFDDVDESDQTEEALLSKFRAQNIDLLADVDQRYAGKKGSRKDFKDESSDEISETSEIDEGASSSEVEDGSSKSDSLTDESEDFDKEDEKSSEASDTSYNEDFSDTADDSNFQHMSETNESEQVKKSLCVRNQLNVWENLLEMRIQMQKCLLAANKMPQNEIYKSMSLESLDFRKQTKEAEKSIGNVLDKLLTLQSLMIKKFPETKHLGKSEIKTKNEGSGEEEEITSSSEDDPEELDSDNESDLRPAKKRKLVDYERDISTCHNKYKEYRNKTIDTWNTKTRLSITKNSGQAHSVVSQIDHILADKEKLIRRTQLKRSDFKIVGQDDEEKALLESNEDNGDVQHQAEEHNKEIFDDTDFYHQLLRELIEVKSADITDPVQLGRQWIQLQNLRSKMKRKIDTRATKGRKIRYAVHSKLVNFMAPMEALAWTDEAKNELYSSLFGKINKRA